MLTPLNAQYEPDGSGNPVWNSPDPEPTEGPDTSDYDGDNLPGWYESYLGTNPYNPDTDGDLITDRDEVFVTSTNPLDSDSDDNGQSDLYDFLQNDPDGDYDADGVANSLDPYPGDSSNYSSVNGNNWGGNVLGDDDGDGVLNWQDETPFPPPADSDGDGCTDEMDPFPSDSTNYSSANGVSWYTDVLGDADSDGVLNWEDSEPYGPSDSDSDGIQDSQDPYPNDGTNYSSINGVTWNNDVLGDADTDGTPNWQDSEPYGPVDSDGDGIFNSEDPFPNDATNFSTVNNTAWYNHVLGDWDSDEVVNWNDEYPWGPPPHDVDDDGIENTLDPYPNDPTNNGWYGDVLGDADNDTIPNWQDTYPYSPQDTDGDGLPLNQEISLGTNDNDVDSDDDGLTDYEEVMVYQSTGVNPANAHTLSPVYTDYHLVDTTDGDGGGIPNRIEQFYGMNPSDPWDDTNGDLDGDGTKNLPAYQYGWNLLLNYARDYDRDNDGMTNVWEIAKGLDPADPTDAYDDPDADYLFNIEEEDANLDPALADTDGNAANGDDFEFTFGVPSAPLGLNHNDLENDGREYNDDWDGDGHNNITEVYAGTDPRDPATHPGAPSGHEAEPPAELPVLTNADPWTPGGPSGGSGADTSFVGGYIPEIQDPPSKPDEIPPLKGEVSWTTTNTLTPFTIDSSGYHDGTPQVFEYTWGPVEALSATAYTTSAEEIFIPFVPGVTGYQCGSWDGVATCNTSTCLCIEDVGFCTCSPSSPEVIGQGVRAEAKEIFYISATFQYPIQGNKPVIVHWKITHASVDGSGAPVVDDHYETVNPGETDGGTFPRIEAGENQRITYAVVGCRYDDSGDPFPPGPIPTVSSSVSDSAGPQFRRVGMDGKPMRDGFPDPQDEYKERQSATYVDAYNATLRHSVTDAYARPAPGTHLSLAVHRDYGEETWSNISGLQFHERPDRPFGAGFTSNICASVTVEKLIRPYNGSVPGTVLNPVRYTATVVDEQGSVQRFKWHKGSQLWIHTREERGDVITSQNTLTSTWDENGDPDNFVLTKFTGGECFYERTPILQTFASNRRDMKESLVQMRYSRLTQATDKRGQAFSYSYGSNSSLVANSITSSIGGGHIKVLLDGNGLVQSVASNTDTATTFGYSTVAGVSVLASATKDGQTTSYQFGSTMEVDPTPLPPDPENPLDGPEQITHVFLTSVTEPGNRTYSFNQGIDHHHSYEQIYVDPESNSPEWRTRKQIGRPHRVSSVSGPGMAASFNCSLSSHIDIEGSMSISAGTLVTGSAGSYTFSFGNGQLFTPPPDVEELWDLNYPHLSVYSWSQMTITGPQGPMSFDFDLNNGANLVSFTGTNGGVTQWTYGSGKSLPSVQINPLGDRRRFAYDSRENLIEVIDARDVRKEYIREPLNGLVKWVNVYDPQGNPIFKRERFYESGAGRQNFARREVVRALHPELGERDLVYEVERDARGNIIREVADPGGLALETRYDYSSRDLLLRTIDPRGYTTRHAYDIRGNRIRTVHPDGSDRVWHYDSRGNLEWEKDEEGTVTFHEYDQLDRLTKTTLDFNGNDTPEGRTVDLVQEWSYNGSHDVIQEKDAKGIVTEHEYRWDGMRDSTTRAGLTTEYDYDLSSMRTIWDEPKPTRVEDPRGAVVETEYDLLLRPVSVEASDGGIITTEYDVVGNPIEVTDALGQVTTTEYDSMDRVVKVTLPGNLTQTTTYNSQGKPITVTDVMGRVTRSYYDDAGRPVKVEQPEITLPNGTAAKPTVQNTYDANGNVVAVTDPLGRVTETWYDARNRAVETATPPAYDATVGFLRRARSTTEYDRLGRVVSTTDAFGQETTKVYDRASRLLETHLPPVSVNGGAPQALMTRSEYDASGNVVEVFDTLGNSTVNEYDALNRLIKTTDALNQITEFGYDGAGNRTSVKDPKGNITTWAYDDLNRVLSETTPAGVIVSHEYDALNKTRTVDAKGQVTTYHYDNRHRLTQMKLYVDAQASTPHNVRTYGYDNAGQLLSVTESADATVNVSYTYDALGRTLSETSRGFTHSYQYDLAGNRVKSTYGGGTGRVVHHAYDGVNRLISLTEAGRVTSWEYDLAGRCVAMTQGNGLVQRQSYDAHHRLVQRALYDEDEGGAGQLMSVELAYDALGNVVRQQERWNQTVGGQVPTSNRTTTMAYDPTSRLVNETAVQHADGSSVSTTYEYDAASNRSKKTISGGAEAGTSTYTYNALNQLTGFEERGPSGALRKTVAYTYDPNGNRVSRTQSNAQGHLYHWDWNNRLAEVETLYLSGGSYVQSYDYDYRMRRTTRQDGGGAAAITYSGSVSVAEYATQNAQTGELYEQPDVEYQRGPDMGGGVGGLLYSLRAENSVRFNVSNGRGDVVAQSDDTGALIWTASYEAFGKRPVEVGSNPDRQRANSKEEDVNTGLLYEGFRYRDLETGTWLSRDPAGFVDGPNLYAYVMQNPWTSWDPDGLESHGQVVDATWNWTRDTAKSVGMLVWDGGLGFLHPRSAAARNVQRLEGLVRLGATLTPATHVLPKHSSQREFESKLLNDFTGGEGNGLLYRSTYTGLNILSFFGVPEVKVGTVIKVESRIAAIDDALRLPKDTPAPAALDSPTAVVKEVGHQAKMTVLDSEGNPILTQQVESGGSGAGRRLSWPEQGKTHTEAKAIDTVRGMVQEGRDVGGLLIEGQKPPCNMCKGAMNKLHTDAGVPSTYVDGQGKIFESTPKRKNE